jgi:hypothetical protein
VFDQVRNMNTAGRLWTRIALLALLLSAFPGLVGASASPARRIAAPASARRTDPGPVRPVESGSQGATAGICDNPNSRRSQPTAHSHCSAYG